MKPEITDGKQLYLRQNLGDGEINGKKFSFSLNIDGKCVFIEFENAWAIYHTRDMITEAYDLIFGEKKVKT